MRTSEVVEQAKAAFKNHGIVGRSAVPHADPCHRWWLIKQPGTGQYHVYIVVLGRHLIVQGDIELCAFAYYSGETAEGAVHWIGGHEFGNYVCEKATIGTTAHELIWDLDSDALTAALHGWLGDLHKAIHEHGEATGRQRDSEAALDDALDRAKGGDLDAFEIEDILRDLVSDGAIEAEQANEAEVPTARVVYAWAAVRRLHELLASEEETP